MGSELEGFKAEIDLLQYAASLGFELSRRDSWRCTAVMKKGSADKIVITRDTDGHYIYYSVKEAQAGRSSIWRFARRRRVATMFRRTQFGGGIAPVSGTFSDSTNRS